MWKQLLLAHCTEEAASLPDCPTYTHEGLGLIIIPHIFMWVIEFTALLHIAGSKTKLRLNDEHPLTD